MRGIEDAVRRAHPPVLDVHLLTVGSQLGERHLEVRVGRARAQPQVDAPGAGHHRGRREWLALECECLPERERAPVECRMRGPDIRGAAVEVGPRLRRRVVHVRRGPSSVPRGNGRRVGRQLPVGLEVPRGRYRVRRGPAREVHFVRAERCAEVVPVADTVFEQDPYRRLGFVRGERGVVIGELREAIRFELYAADAGRGLEDRGCERADAGRCVRDTARDVELEEFVPAVELGDEAVHVRAVGAEELDLALEPGEVLPDQ